MTTPTQQDAPTMFYPLNLCGHLRGPSGGCFEFPSSGRVVPLPVYGGRSDAPS